MGVSLTVRAKDAVGLFSPIVSDGDIVSKANLANNTFNPDYQFLGGLGGPLASGVNNTDFVPPNARWIGPPTCGNYMPRYSNTQTRIRPLSLGYYRYDFNNQTNFFSFGLALDSVTPYPEVFIHGYVYFVKNVPLQNLQWKFIREMWLPSIVDNDPQCLYSHWLNNGVSADQWTDNHSGSQPASDMSPFGTAFQGSVGFPNGMPPFNTGEWYRFEYYHKVATGLATNDGFIRFKMYRTSDGFTYNILNISNLDDFDSARRFQYIVFQNFFGNFDNDITLNGDQCAAYYEDIFVQFGTGAWQTLWVSDAATIGAANLAKLAIQPPSAWVPGSVSFRANKGPHADLNGKYLYQKDSAGNFISNNGVLL